MRILIIFLLIISFGASAQKSKTQAKVVDDLVMSMEEVKLPAQPVRLAVVPFTSAVATNDPKNTFGEYLTELMIGKVSENTGKFKLFERSRLDAIFKENELMLSGMMKPSEAIRIGELLPIDALFSGTYTKLKSYVDVSGRLIDVTSGEILTSYTGRIKLSKNLLTLFPESNNSTGTGISESNGNQGNEASGINQNTTITVVATLPENNPSEEELCKKKVTDFKLLLTDFSTEEKINSIANEAMKTPFDNQCGQLHYELMYAFRRYKIEHEPYRKFLLTTLEQITLPSQDDRSLSIIEFLVKDRDLNEVEWKSVLNTITRLEGGAYRYLSPVFKVTETETAKSRIDDYFNLVKSQKMGIPKPVTYDYAFYQMMQGLGKQQELLVYTYERYGGKLQTEPVHHVSSHMLYLNRMYEAETEPATKTKILKWVATYFQQHVYEKSPEQLFDFAYKFRLKDNPSGNRSIEEDNIKTREKFPESDLILLIELCKDQFSSYATQTKYSSQLEDRIAFCIQYGIPVPGAIPTMSEADEILKGNDLHAQEEVMKLLIQMGDMPKSLEGTLINLLDKRSLEDKSLMTSIQTYAIIVLGNIGTTNPRAINHMISRISSFDYKESEAAREAISKIGKPAIDPLLTKLKSTTIHDGGLRYQLIVLLGKNGKAAKAAEPTLLKIQKENTNKDIAYAIEAALQAIH